MELSKSAINVVLESLIGLLEELARPFTTVSAHPRHILLSELFLLALAGDCCSANWAALWHEDEADSFISPAPLDKTIVSRIFDVLKLLLEPLPDYYVLPAQALLDQVSIRSIIVPRNEAQYLQDMHDSINDIGSLGSHLAEFDKHMKTVVEYITASSWSFAFDYVRNVIYNVRTTIVVDSSAEPSSSSQEAEKAALVIVRLLSFFWVDSFKLGLLIQEVCSSYLHLRRPYQNTVAAAMPLLIARWIDRFPHEFVQLHRLHKRLDGGPDTLFDMTHTVMDVRRKALLYPLQTTLLFLLPDVFEVASNLREAKSNSVMKKVSFLDVLRKAMRNGNEQAGYCLVFLLRAARHFEAEGDSALVSYALDVQDEIRDAVFRQSVAGSTPQFDQNMVTAAFISLAHLNLDGCIDTLIGDCTSSLAPESFKIAVVQACCYFANQPYALKYHDLFDKALPFMQSHLKVELYPKRNLMHYTN